MSDQQQTGPGVFLDLEGLFLSREFGRRPARSIWSAPAAVVSEPAHLEQVFLSDVFGHPEVVARATQAVGGVAGAPTARRPALVLLPGGGAGSSEHDSTRARAIAAVSGVAAAALAVAGLASGTGQGPGSPPVTEQAQGRPGPAGGSQPGSRAEPTVPSGSSSTGPSGGGGTDAALTAFSSPAPALVPSAATGTGATTPPATPAPSSGGPPPGSPPGSGGGGSMLAPVLDVVGNEVSGVSSTVTATSGHLGQAVGQALGTVGTSATNNVGGGSPPNILGAA